MQKIILAVFGLEPKKLIGRVVQIEIEGYTLKGGNVVLDADDPDLIGPNCVLAQITSLRMNGRTAVAELSVREINAEVVESLQIREGGVSLELDTHEGSLVEVPVKVRLA